MKKTLLIITSLISGALAQAQTNPVLVEHFDYSAGTNLQDNGWTGHSAATTNPIKVSDGGLSWTQTPYLGSGVGNAALVNNTGSDENKAFNAWIDSTSKQLYVGFLMKVNYVVSSNNQGYFFHINSYQNVDTPNYALVNTAFRARTFVVQGSSADKFKLGMTFDVSTTPSTATNNVSGDLDTGKTYLVIVKYTFVDGPVNDESSIYIFEDGADLSAEPSMPSVGPIKSTLSDLSILQNVALRQYNSSQRITVDGLIARTDWNWLPAPTPVAPALLSPPDNTSLLVSGPAETPVSINWSAAKHLNGSVSYEWQADLRSMGSYAPPALALASDNSGADTMLSLNFGAIDMVLASLGLNVDDTLKAVWRVRAVSGTDTLYSESFNIDLIRGYIMAPLSPFNLLSPANGITVVTKANDLTEIEIVWESSTAGTMPVSYQWVLDTLGGDFSMPLVMLPSNSFGVDTALTVTLAEADELLADLGLAPGDSITLQWAVMASADTQSRLSSNFFTVTLKRFKEDPASVNNQALGTLNAYPNPNAGIVQLQFNEQVSGLLNIQVSDAMGRVVMRTSEMAASNMSISLDGLNNGMYWIQVQSENASYLQRIVLQK